jgi:hypothetical protein
VSICIYCGQDHAASVRICPKTGKAIGVAPAAQKTLFGIGAAIMPPVETSSAKDAPSVPVSLPPPKPVPTGNQSNALALGKTMFGVPAGPPAGSATGPTSGSASPPQPTLPTTPAKPKPAAMPRLPTEQEARDNPDLVISLDFTPTPAPMPVTPREPPTPRREPVLRREPVAPEPAVNPVMRPEAVFSETPIDLPSVVEPIRRSKTDANGAGDPVPMDLPPVGKGKRFVLPEPKHAAPASPGEGQASGSGGVLADARSVWALLGWALGTYLRKPKSFFLLAALLVLPAAVVQSCGLAGVAPVAPAKALDPSVGTVDFSKLKADLAARVRDSQLRGDIDKQAAAELAALAAMEAAHVPTGHATVEGSSWLWSALGLLLQGLLMFGLAFPIAAGLLAVAAVDDIRGAKTPTFSELWPILLTRGELFLITLLPAAMVAALGYALLVLPGLCASVLFLFLPHVVLFEKKDGRVALSRSIELVRKDITRVVLTFLAFALAALATALVTRVVFSVSDSRAITFLRFLVGDVLVVAIFPVPALVLARLYLDSRSRAGATPERLAQAARS